MHWLQTKGLWGLLHFCPKVRRVCTVFFIFLVFYVFGLYLSHLLLYIGAAKTFREMWLTIFGILGAFLYVNEPVSAQADGCRTDKTYFCPLHGVVCASRCFDKWGLRPVTWRYKCDCYWSALFPFQVFFIYWASNAQRAGPLHWEILWWDFHRWTRVPPCSRLLPWTDQIW